MKRSDIKTQLVQLLVLANANNLTYTKLAEEILGLLEIRDILPPQPIGTNWRAEWEKENEKK